MVCYGCSEWTTTTAIIIIQDIYHERAWLQSHVDQVNVKVVAETSGEEATNNLLSKLEAMYPVKRDGHPKGEWMV